MEHASTEPKPDPDELLTFTLPRQQWNIIAHLAIRGGKEALVMYIKGEAHDENCIVADSRAVKALHDLLYPEKAAKTAVA